MTHLTITIMRKLICIILFSPIMVFCQNKHFTFSSDYQFDKTYDGSKKESRHTATISFSDPKSITVNGADLEGSPKGYMIFKFKGVDSWEEDIVYMGNNSQGYDIYAITNTQTDNDIIYVIKSKHKIRTKLYNYTIILGKEDQDNMGGLPKYFTAFHCNMIKNDDLSPNDGNYETKNVLYIVTSKKVYFFNTPGEVNSRRKAYLVAGENITGLKDTLGYIYCEFTNLVTKKTSKGWIQKGCLQEVN